MNNNNKNASAMKKTKQPTGQLSSWRSRGLRFTLFGPGSTVMKFRVR